MKELKRTKEQQKDYIFDIFSKCHSETVSNRLQVYYPTLCEQIYLWYRDYLSINVDKMGLEITNVINNFIEDKNIPNIPKDKDGFFKYLAASISNEKAGSNDEYNEKDKIKIPKEKRRKLREVEDFIRMKESQLGRKLTVAEEESCISKWFKKQEYIDLYNAKNVGKMHVKNNETDETDDLEFPDTHTDDPLDELINKNDMETVMEAVTSILNKKRKTKDCDRALFTLYCIKNDLNGLYPILDQEIIDAFHKDGKKPNQYEIYQKYHPECEKISAEVMAATNLREFRNDIKTYLTENK